MIQTIQKHRYLFMVWTMIGLYIAYFSWFTILRHQTFHSHYYDLGIMDQTVYNTSQGRILELTRPETTETIKRMAIHNDVFLAFLAPLYYLFSGPETLLVVQSVILGFGGLLVYLIAHHVLRSEKMALVFSFAYLMYPPLQWSNAYDFHAVTASTTFLLALFYCVMKERYRWALVFFILANTTKEQVALTTGFFGFMLLVRSVFSMKMPIVLKRPNLQNRSVQFGLMICILSTVWFVVQNWYIIPHFRGSEHFAIERYKDFGSTPTEVITGILSKPQLVFNWFFNYAVLNYLIALFAPTAFMSFLSPALLALALPELAINILSNSQNMTDIIHHYTAVITPFVFIASIYGARAINHRFTAVKLHYIAVVLVCAVVFSSYKLSPLPYSKKADNRTFTEHLMNRSDVAIWQQRLKDERIKISASGRLAAHFAHRITIDRFSSLYGQADYVLIFVPDTVNDWYDAQDTANAYASLKQDPLFERIYKNGNFEVYMRVANIVQ